MICEKTLTQLPLDGLAEAEAPQQKPPPSAETPDSLAAAKRRRRADQQQARRMALKGDPEKWKAYLERCKISDGKKYQKQIAKIKANPVLYAAWLVKTREQSRIQKLRHPGRATLYRRKSRPLKPRPPKLTPEEIKARKNEYQNRPENVASRTAYYRNRKKNDPAYAEKCRKKSAESFQKNKVKIMARAKERIKENPESNRKYMREYTMNKRRTEPHWNIRNRLASRIWHAIAGQGNGKKAFKTQELVGCTVMELRDKLQAQFTEGMSWEHFLAGEIEIDHIVPCSLFDLTDPEQQKRCNHFSNLQPLWTLDNQKKGNKLPPGVPHPNPPCVPSSLAVTVRQ